MCASVKQYGYIQVALLLWDRQPTLKITTLHADGNLHSNYNYWLQRTLCWWGGTKQAIYI
jgi:hypothetical protein